MTLLKGIDLEMRLAVLDEIPVGDKFVPMDFPPGLDKPYLALVEISDSHLTRCHVKCSLALLKLRVEVWGIVFAWIDANDDAKEHR